MPFGYFPLQDVWKDTFLKIVGYPSVIRRMQAPVILRMLDPKKHDLILDAGCDMGQFTFEIANVCRCVGIDWKTRENWPHAMRNLSSVTYLGGDAQKMPFLDGVFHKILLSSVLQMVNDDELLLSECHRVLRTDGLLVLSVPTEYIYVKKLNEVKRELNERFRSRGKGYYKTEEIRRLLRKCGFEIVEIEYAPKRLGSFLFEAKLYFCYRANLPLFHPAYFSLLYPLAYFDRFDDKKQKGNEIIIKSQKIRKQKD